jgi:hypothetical protein
MILRLELAMSGMGTYLLIRTLILFEKYGTAWISELDHQ